MARQPGQTKENYEKRLECMEKYQQKYRETNRKLSNKRLSRLLVQDGHRITNRQLILDKKEIMSRDTYVSDLAQYSYSSIVQEEMKDFDEAKRIVKEIARSKELPEITVVKGLDEKGNKYISTTTKKSASHRIQAVRLLSSMSLDKIKLISGDVLDTSVADYIQRVKELENEVFEKEQKLQQLKEDKYKKTVKNEPN